ncbi:hypothetical protein STSO111631_00385 [Stackebrandtia soli]
MLETVNRVGTRVGAGVLLVAAVLFVVLLVTVEGAAERTGNVVRAALGFLAQSVGLFVLVAGVIAVARRLGFPRRERDEERAGV